MVPGAGKEMQLPQLRHFRSTNGSDVEGEATVEFRYKRPLVIFGIAPYRTALSQLVLYLPYSALYQV